MADTVDPQLAESYPTREEYDASVNEMIEAAKAYYDSDVLLMDDASYDMAVARIAASEKLHPEWKTTNLSDAVAGGVSAGGDYVHNEPMLSLDKAHKLEDVEAYLNRSAKLVNVDDITYTVEPKLDGVALSLHYADGKLLRVVTRGDGLTGEDITEAVTNAIMDGMPRSIKDKHEFEVRGECVLTVDQFEKANDNRVNVDGKPVFVNRRNAVSGIIRAKDRNWKADLTFAAYSLHGHEKAATSGGRAQMEFLKGLGFKPAMDLAGTGKAVKGVQGVEKELDKILNIRHDLIFEIDGAVIKVDDVHLRAKLGATGSHPRWALAYKYPAEQRTTRVLGIDVNPGRTGVLVPRAILEPVFVGGTTISFATLHNPGEVARLDVRIGDLVQVCRAGEVIPRVEGVVLAKRPADSVPWEAPKTCPRCGGAIDTSEKRWRCVRGRLCGAAELLTYACGRDALDIEGMGETLINKLVENGMVVDLPDIFDLKIEKLAAMERMGQKSAEKVVEQIEASKTKPLSRWITALGLRMTGRRMSRRLAKEFHTLENFRAASLEALENVEGVGVTRAETIFEEVRELAGMIDRLVEKGVSPEPDGASAATEADANGEPAVKDLPLAGKTVVVSGTVPGMSRTEAQEAAEALGAKTSGSVSKTTSILICGPGAGSKQAKAESLGVAVMDSAEFAKMVAEHNQG